MPFMMGISQLLTPLDEYDLTFPDLTAFIQLVCMAKPFIHQCMTDIQHPPIHPPEVVISLLAGTLSQDPLTILACWVAFCQVIWTHGAVLPTDQEIEVFNCHGLVCGIECHTRYYPNYWTNNTNSTCIYYAGVPSVIQAARHFYIEAVLLELFAATKVFRWMSSMNCAHMYNYALAQWHAYILNNRCAFDATLPQALDKEFSWHCLVLPHDEQQQIQIDVVLSIGQEAYPHACDLCFIVIGDDNSKYLNQWCAVDGCDEVNASGFRTCANTDHQALEDAYFKPTKALFQLQAQLKRAGVTLPLDSVPSSLDSGSSNPNSTDEDLEVIVGSECDTWATFFGSEAVSAVNLTFKLKEFAKAVFPTATSTPEYFVFDNNCKLHTHQDAIGDDHFAATGMPVDVFHFNSKHKETDTYCQQHCNPAAFPELISGGKWRFNTSICEQTNVWLGGYQAILQDMSVHRQVLFKEPPGLPGTYQRWNQQPHHGQPVLSSFSQHLESFMDIT
ncbi:uncharacterized protein BJ212DRAFT_1301747 [Suillus subaureus]|uniref:CxC5 like cysteine cluster associated with KDZ domain-containing protein n=1 Tax=Suillus subaureus TaxID=48587 RepID=A0A9P7E609_9AGAM|nr:uncharacterized protein BJ212DRAFT_1301747 [Suillus subaureus]KAG1812248.1 hypothetical protein BJ212DRAFT_1301747 [Suillus subaureus]